ncbi:MAG TPA: hypothetical protein VM537_04280, partial [Anaerolineae bacterium]|nr:hypothetical protein [Anaerolineae bacterium]
MKSKQPTLPMDLIEMPEPGKPEPEAADDALEAVAADIDADADTAEIEPMALTTLYEEERLEEPADGPAARMMPTEPDAAMEPLDLAELAEPALDANEVPMDMEPVASSSEDEEEEEERPGESADE